MPAKSNKASARKKVEAVLPLERVLRVFHSRFDDPSRDPLAYMTSQDFAGTFTDIPRNHIEEALFHYANYTDDKILKTETIDVKGKPTRVWHIRGAKKEPNFDSGEGRFMVPG